MYREKHGKLKNLDDKKKWRFVIIPLSSKDEWCSRSVDISHSDASPYLIIWSMGYTNQLHNDSDIHLFHIPCELCPVNKIVPEMDS